MAIQAKMTARGVPLEAAYVRLDQMNGNKRNGYSGSFSVYFNEALACPPDINEEVPDGNEPNGKLKVKTVTRPGPVGPTIETFGIGSGGPFIGQGSPAVPYAAGEDPFVLLYDAAKEHLKKNFAAEEILDV